ncbi:GNAT family protein [Nonomuraea sp. NPDC050310]|uniref:GNAT family N-acetyltransferase n=1 Tax=unclassified Nonomuraea TaxID=2593643 RepID=UPI0033D0640D
MLTGDLIRLRPLEPGDAEALWRWGSDPEVIRYMGAGQPESLAQLTKRHLERPTNTYSNTLLGAETLETGKLIGAVRLRDAQPEIGDAELDIWIGEKDHWGRGFATDTMRTMCRYGFDELRLHRITLWVVAENVAARRVYEKVGFVQEGVARESFRRAGKWHDMVLMGLLEGELR